MDVKAPYPSVPTKQGLGACGEALNNRKEKTTIMQITETIFDNILNLVIHTTNLKQTIQALTWEHEKDNSSKNAKGNQLSFSDL